MSLKMPVGQEKEPPRQGLLSESTQSLIILSSLGKDTQPSSTALNQACAFPAQRCHRKQDVIEDASLGKREQFQFVCAYVGEGRTGGVKGQQTPARHCPGFINSSIKTVCSVNCKLNKIPHLEQNSEYRLQKKLYQLF